MPVPLSEMVARSVLVDAGSNSGLGATSRQCNARTRLTLARRAAWTVIVDDGGG
jgi:hypothetical protein